jgi:hypothetical protein
MTDPPRLVESCSDDFARTILRSSRDDAGSTKAYQRTLASLGAGVAVELTAVGAANAAVPALLPTAKLGIFGFVKLLGTGAAVGVATVAGLHVVTEPTQTPASAQSAVTQAVLPAPAQPIAAPEAKHSPDSVLPAEPERAPVRSLRGASVPATSPDILAPVPGEASRFGEPDSASPLAPSGTLEREVRALDAVKQALARENARGALSALAAYEREFAGGALVPEARVLRVRALLAAGDREGALHAASQVVEADPHGRHAAVVKALIARSANP